MITFQHPAFINNRCVIDEDFEHPMQLMGDKALVLGLKIYVNSSFRMDDKVRGAIVPPAHMSDHMIGEAIDANIYEGKKFWTSEMLKNPTGKVLEFITYCKSIGLRWGGDFSKRDTVHFDSGLNVKDPAKWHEKYNLIHK